MPLHQHYLSEFAFAELKEKVLAAYGQTVNTKADCEGLSEEIGRRTRKTISVNTIRRLFDVMPTGSKPSHETLNVLSLFCGYTGFYDFQQALVSKTLHFNEEVTSGTITIYIRPWAIRLSFSMPSIASYALPSKKIMSIF